jgi:asparagine synthase (glutamine-hydrolysing)
MLDVIAHRGPDDEGYFAIASDASPICWGGQATSPEAYQYPYAVPLRPGTPAEKFRVALGSRRLAITDTSAAGHQPLSNPTGSLWIVFNGEIYNHLELRPQLSALGYQFHSQCDTETLLCAYAAWGPCCLSKLTGQFAFVILDCENQTYFAARDRFAIKPLYFTTWNQVLCLASEIKQFTRLPGWRPELNHQTAFEFLRWGTIDHTSQTLFQNVQQLAGGHFLQGNWKAPCENVIQRRWYQPEVRAVPSDYPEATELFGHLLNQAVLNRARTDQPLGLSFSGGLDSVSIASIVQASGSCRTFSACSEDPRLNEKPLIDEVTRQFPRLHPHFCMPDQDKFLRELSRLVWHQDEPFNGTSLFAEWCVFELAGREGVRVSLEGHGADECLLGYASLLGPYAQECFEQRRYWLALKNLSRAAGSGFVSPLGLLGLLARQFAPPRLLQAYRKLKGLPAQEYPAWICRRSLRADPPAASRLGQPKGSLRALQESGLWDGGLAHQLHWSDRSSMAHSIESRVPYLDHELVEYCLSLPGDYLFRAGKTKAILRDAFRDLAPAQVVERVPKIGYATAEQMWVGQAPGAVWQLCQRALQSSEGIFNQATLNRCNRIIRGQEAYDSWIWRIISFGLWMEQFQVRLGQIAA